MPMFIKLDIAQRGRISAKIKYGDNITGWADASEVLTGKSVSDVFQKLANHYRKAGIDPKPAPETK